LTVFVELVTKPNFKALRSIVLTCNIHSTFDGIFQFIIFYFAIGKPVRVPLRPVNHSN